MEKPLVVNATSDAICLSESPPALSSSRSPIDSSRDAVALSDASTLDPTATKSSDFSIKDSIAGTQVFTDSQIQLKSSANDSISCPPAILSDATSPLPTHPFSQLTTTSDFLISESPAVSTSTTIQLDSLSTESTLKPSTSIIVEAVAVEAIPSDLVTSDPLTFDLVASDLKSATQSTTNNSLLHSPLETLDNIPAAAFFHTPMTQQQDALKITPELEKNLYSSNLINDTLHPIPKQQDNHDRNVTAELSSSQPTASQNVLSVGKEKQDADLAPLAKKEAPPPEEYFAKEIQFQGQPLSILLQNQNGPCPLIALCNVLSLQRKVTFPDALITANQLIELLMQLLAEKLQKSPDNADLDKNIADVMDVVTNQLARGLDMNLRFKLLHSPPFFISIHFDSLKFSTPRSSSFFILDSHTRHAPSSCTYCSSEVQKLIFSRFGSIFSFELTPQRLVFESLGVDLCHGWLADPQDPLHVVVSDMSYNQAVDRSLSAKDLHGLQCAHFLESTKSQLTHHGWSTPSLSHQLGVMTIGEKMASNSLCVLFRNNHFHTLFKHRPNGSNEFQLFTLVTDVGVAWEGNGELVWESLTVDGDSVFVDGRDFSLVDDYAMALSLQQQLDVQDAFEVDHSNSAQSLPPYARASASTAANHTETAVDRTPHTNIILPKQSRKIKESCLLM